MSDLDDWCSDTAKVTGNWVTTNEGQPRPDDLDACVPHVGATFQIVAKGSEYARFVVIESKGSPAEWPSDMTSLCQQLKFIPTPKRGNLVEKRLADPFRVGPWTLTTVLLENHKDQSGNTSHRTMSCYWLHDEHAEPAFTGCRWTS